MEFNIHLLHNVVFYLLYAMAAVVTFIAIERIIFFTFTIRQARLCLQNAAPSPKSVVADMVTPLQNAENRHASRHQMEDLAESGYIKVRTQLVHHLWALDTIVTAAPLLGLVGTIFGIIDTFAALASSGISDPSAVSAGIGTALYATALGIGIALYGLIFYNLFQNRVERISDKIKLIILKFSGAQASV
ncbi:MAG TPA: MotA/TolQ/ExbB proton channel family protein [Halothiobacillus sp.]|nr:MotA/TolQ/ExbB proton channel family protein [Halothiobacillus sp.]